LIEGFRSGIFLKTNVEAIRHLKACSTMYVVRVISVNFGLHAGKMTPNTKKEERIISSVSRDAMQRRLAITDVSGRKKYKSQLR
jgi:hypothetical protein